MTSQLTIVPTDDSTLDVAQAAFLGLQRGAATGDWSGFVDLLSENVSIMIPVPASEENPPEGVLRGKDVARQMFATHHQEQVSGVKLEVKRVSANGPVVVLECRIEGNLGGENAANYFVFAFEVTDGLISSMYEYSVWTAKRPESQWGDLTFARDAFDTTVIPYVAEHYEPVTH
jgi:ketosteroid isomerase-like protein